MRSKAMVVVFIVVLAMSGAGYWVGRYTARQTQARESERIAAEYMTGAMGVVHLLDGGDVAGAQRALLGTASSHLDVLIDGWQRYDVSAEYAASRCRAVLWLKALRAKHGYLTGPGDRQLREDPSIAQVERKRQEFLDGVRCSRQ